MSANRKPAAGKKPAAGGGGCLTLLVLPILIPLIVLAVFVWVCLTFAAGLLQAAFSVPRSGRD